MFVLGNSLPAPPPFFAGLLAFALLIVGCSDSAITDIAVSDKERIDPSGITNEVLPGIINEEPPELVAAYDDLSMDIIERKERTGEVDSSKVLEANRLAVELAKYDGPMAFTLKMIQAKSEGKSDEELREIVEQRYGLANIMGKTNNNPCVHNCAEDLGLAIFHALENQHDDYGDCLTEGLWGFVSVDLADLVANGGEMAECYRQAVRDYDKALRQAEQTFRVCLDRCGPE